jgi:hypothetical protein
LSLVGDRVFSVLSLFWYATTLAENTTVFAQKRHFLPIFFGYTVRMRQNLSSHFFALFA